MTRLWKEQMLIGVFQCQCSVLYLDGDKDAGLPRHRMPVFLDERGRALNMYAHVLQLPREMQ